MAKSIISAGYLQFLWAGLMKHAQTGSIFPSQRFLIDAMLAPVRSDFAGRIVELGTGTAPLTVRLVAKCPKARLVGCEINPVLAERARQNLARAGINGNVKVHAMSAQELLAQLRSGKDPLPQYVISGLPLGNLARGVVLDLLHAIKAVLAPKGMFIQVQHFLVDRRKVRAIFSEVRTVPVLRNLPPAFVYYATK